MKKSLCKNLSGAYAFYYAAPKLYEHPYYYVKYAYEHPRTHNIKSARIRLTKIAKSYTNKVDALRAIKAEVNALDIKLRGGWTPFGYHTKRETLISLLDVYISYKKKELRTVSCRNMETVLTRFATWLKTHRLADVQADEFTSRNSLDYTDFLCSLGIKTVTYNNYISILHNFFEWIRSRRLYNIENVWNHLKDRNTQEKDRAAIPPDLDDVILSYFRIYNPAMELIIQMVYQLFLRPSEILNLRCNDIDIINETLIVRASISKTHRQRNYSLPQNIIDLLLHLGYKNNNKLLIGFGIKEPRRNKMLRRLAVGDDIVEACDINRLDMMWNYMRKKLDLSSCYKLYSYRDSGIQDLANRGLPNEVIKMITGHRCSDTISIYVNHKADTTRQKLVLEFVKPIGHRDTENNAIDNVSKIIKDEIL